MMRFRIICAVAVGLLPIGLVSLCNAAEPTPFSWNHSNYEQLKDLEYFVGEWRHEGTIMDEPYRSSATFEWVMNKNFLMHSANIEEKGTTTQDFMGLTGWDSTAQSIKLWGYWINGLHITGTQTKTEGGWNHNFTVSGINGQKKEVEGALTIVDENVYTYDDGGICFTATRVAVNAASQTDQAPPRSDKLAVLKPLLGKWSGTLELEDDIPEMAKKGESVDFTLAYRWSRNGQAIQMEFAFIIDDQPLSSTNGMIVWDPVAEKIVGTDTYAHGGMTRYDVEVDVKKLVLKAVGGKSDGTKTSETYTFNIDSRDQRTVDITNRKEGRQSLPDIVGIELKRLKRTK